MSDETNTSATDAAPAADEDVFEYTEEDGSVSRFSKAEAEAAGWVFVHERGEYTTTDSSTQGRTTTIAPRLVAERYISPPGHSATLITETAETMGKLLERIFEYERHLERVGITLTAPEVDLSATPRAASTDEDGGLTIQDDVPAGSVLLPADPNDLDNHDVIAVSDAEFAARSRNDVLIVRGEDGEPVQQFLSGSVSDAERGMDNHLARKAAVEYARTEDTNALDVETEQITYDVMDTVDAPGQSAGGVVIVRKGESLEDASVRLDEEAHALETERVAASAGGTEAPPEEEEELAGVDAGLARRGDLESEIPDTGSVDTQPAERVQGGVEVPEESPTTASVEAASAAGEEAALEARDNADNAEEADGPDVVQRVEDASAEAAQHAHDEIAEPTAPKTSNEDGSVEDALPQEHTSAPAAEGRAATHDSDVHDERGPQDQPEQAKDNIPTHGGM
jgi:hypothetical protein